MDSPVKALIWETWRLTYRQWVLQVVAATVLTFLALGLLPADIYATERSLVAMGIILVSLFFLAVTSPATASKTTGYTGFRFGLAYKRPITTLQLVTTPMVYLLGMNLLGFLIPVFLLMSFHDIEVSLFQSGVVISVCLLLYIGLNWWTANPFLNLSLTGLIFLVALNLPNGQASEPWLGERILGWFLGNDIPALGWATLLGLALCALILTVSGVTRQRYGEELLGLDLFRRIFTRNLEIVKSRNFSVTVPCPVSSAFLAELWKSMRGRLVRLLIIAVIAGVATFWMLSGTFETGDMVTIIGFVALALTFQISSVTFVSGYRIWSAGIISGISNFDRLALLGTARLALIRVTASALITALVLIAYLGVLAVWPMLFDVPSLELGQFLKPVPLITGASWAVMLLGQFLTYLVFQSAFIAACIVSAGRVERITLMLAGYSLAVSLFVLYIKTDSVNWSTAMIPVLQFHAWIALGGVIVATGCLFYSTYKHCILSTRDIGRMLLLWALYVLLTVRMYSGIEIVQTAELIESMDILLGLCLLPLFAAVLSPWLMGRLRHH